ncbi:glycosyltransferase family 2 protein [Plectonema cf. radiosum LEGE 06105]|uniref:Glycosyltransferase family 2 protein n=1 Tax=Plectonema cf. radiosum LEGE 06105 TaxID=945769 RepID=A0A8J7JVW4_9CYAN|nr:glycosyltransferase family A protein [Plectonema radiosum]MBE9216254.1 glycosyltransferase family 2 protein [Plectonema cf. radiosum LEGE 06105]
MNESRNSPVLLSLIVPAVKPELHLEKLFISLQNLNNEQIEMVLINQSGKAIDTFKNILNIKLVEHVRIKPIPAPEARNIGASLASGEYLFFLDDDAVVYSPITAIEELIVNLLNAPDVVIVQRGEINNNKYISHWPDNTVEVNYKNFTRMVIEWNLIIKRELFLELGGFCDIGTGSNHAALSGEAFILFAKILSRTNKIQLFPQILIAHPSLFATEKPAKNALGYAYGTGYAVGIGLRYFNYKMKFYWLIRFLVSTLFYDFFRSEKEYVKVTENIDFTKYRFAISKCKIFGFIDSILRKEPRNLNWLIQGANEIIFNN